MINEKITWPNGAKCACCITFDMDADSTLHLSKPTNGFRYVSAISGLQYGPFVAIPRIIESYKSLNIKQTFFIPAWCIENYIKTVELILENGHEVGIHGYLHENLLDHSLDGERRILEKSINVFKRYVGYEPKGFRAPLYNFTNNTGELLVEFGFDYDSSLMGDDMPYIITPKNGEIIELPTHWGMDDGPQFVQPYVYTGRPIRSPTSGFEIFKQEFFASYKYGGLWLPVFHPYASGRLARWDVINSFLEEIISKRDVWFAPLSEIAIYVKDQIQAGHYRPMNMKVPQYAQQILNEHN